MLYIILKIIHIMSASVLFGTGMGTALYMLIVNFSNNIVRSSTGFFKVSGI